MTLANAAMTEQQFKQVNEQTLKKLNTIYTIDVNKTNTELTKLIKEFNAYPDAIAIGVMFKCQKVVGICVASQMNIGYNGNKELEASLYGIGGATAGIAETLRMEVYTALCWGDCLGGLSQGIYVGADAGLSFGSGVSGFIEVGTDITELFGFGRDFNPLDFWNYKTVYAGIAYNIGVGFGISGNMYYYNNIWNKKINLDQIEELEF